MLHRTRINNLITGWRVRGHDAQIVFLRDLHDRRTPGYRMRADGSHVPMPADTETGYVTFDERMPPDLAQAREWFPEHHALWNEVKADYWRIVNPSNGYRTEDLPLPPHAPARLKGDFYS
ncbi:hypothetical protein [Nocardia mexicana]|uniref:Uncharacterized protein n=1 Tax=Nocardia mexicana TaxID=279262 RepID=A0A370HD15_9NOCA|nr:hypothetical protein [Nocardia mexicana]RDI54670.1 hypothetical protein DFR68_102800 [Nocardia mexicana]